jgi:hypothetical protein
MFMNRAWFVNRWKYKESMAEITNMQEKKLDGAIMNNLSGGLNALIADSAKTGLAVILHDISTLVEYNWSILGATNK